MRKRPELLIEIIQAEIKEQSEYQIKSNSNGFLWGEPLYSENEGHVSCDRYYNVAMEGRK